MILWPVIFTPSNAYYFSLSFPKKAIFFPLSNISVLLAWIWKLLQLNLSDIQVFPFKFKILQ